LESDRPIYAARVRIAEKALLTGRHSRALTGRAAETDETEFHPEAEGLGKGGM